MILLDTDHLTVHAFPESERFAWLSRKIRSSQEEFGTTIVCLEEQLRGWLASIRRKQDDHEPQRLSAGPGTARRELARRIDRLGSNVAFP